MPLDTPLALTDRLFFADLDRAAAERVLRDALAGAEDGELFLEYRESEAISLQAPAGSLIAYDGGAWHAGSANRTAGPRRAIHAFFLRPWVQPHWDFRASLSRRAARALTAEQRALLGFAAGPRRYDPWADDSCLGEEPGVLARLRAILRRRLLAR